ncbi:beta-ketoacyl-ACP synthase III [Oleiphilus sp. HI0071]|uniref:beta-ketoacyl-ACP synthase III n=1 Tax=unclassified Oleiphilus TaxID=2631174 RepID=UPI0007C409F1|nr:MULTISPECIES: beta-ketoacyl-ACP synthase III [unclassified Oleiphilus]KZY68527.1 beta-ketoacyl-ACP synthase III [Oleiphilus sp. HI0065]KZY83024.1 beta-ketoacyl-ACP synthase III [Oleiphilus sp. HI0071]KZY98769.1 beta-ketoacyl-ACP synthase III [Oleiphilus sp. HI0073]KZZ40729.1 beta-ketoacyl-ACP synthase III [Oleiphilus sp. HI0118]KZZ61362.1 beta-ketoacyl-ACP synthase III [Oleiphilus sp. HI0122]KZZ82236.1 beta-ketoacyl-ACP synthase III [Oleiphilus sp. HI0133]
MYKAAITGTGLFTPSQSISNDELVDSFNRYVAAFNAENEEAIASGDVEALHESSSAFIEKASGIKSRYVIDKSGILDPEIMAPRIPERPNSEPSVLCEMATEAAKQALGQANKTSKDVDAVLVACSNLQRAYPAISIEVQDALEIEGFAFDMNVACSSATFALQTALDLVKAGTARSVLVLNPEVCSAHLNFRDRDSHFIFGDVATAILVERQDLMAVDTYYEVVSAKLKTLFSNNIRNNFGFMNRCAPEAQGQADKLFVQEGRKVFKEVSPMVANMIVEHLSENGFAPEGIKRLWLHQANLNMNQLIAKKVLGRPAESLEAPVILDEYANTSSAGSIIAFHKHRDDLNVGDTGVICSFGAGYSVGSVIVKKCAS